MRSHAFLAALVICLVLGILASFPGDCQAIPAFARKYETSCQTCHVAFPALTAFGEAFRRNGYRFPEGTDPDFSKLKDVPLGSEGYRKVFPRAVWPGSLPREMPLAAIAETEFAVAPHEKPHTQFTGFGSVFEFLAAGTLGERISFFDEVPLEMTEDGSVEVGIERAFAVIKPGDLPNVVLRIGRFDVGLANVSEHRGFLGDYWLLDRNIGERADSLTGSGNDVTLEPAQQGLEAAGTPGGRFAYTVGLVEGSGGEPNEAKDFYGRAEYKFGGLRLDGVESGEPSALTAPSPWRDNSVTFGAFAYRGKTLLGDPETQDRFYFAGADVYANAANLLVRAGYAREHHDAPFTAMRDIEANVDHFFVEAQHVLYPWLLPIVRYELYSSTLSGPGAETSQDDVRIIPGIVALVRANVSMIVKADIEKIGDAKWNGEEINASLAIVF